MKQASVSELHRTALTLDATFLIGGCALSDAPILDYRLQFPTLPQGRANPGNSDQVSPRR
jgi:hypothetical protein